MLVGICGYARSGKDTVADRLVQELGLDRYSFAMPLKRVVNAFLGWPVDDMDLPFKDQKVDVDAPDEVIAQRANEAMDEYFKYGLNYYKGAISAFLELSGGMFASPEDEARTLISPRRAYQYFGTEVMRSANPNVWIDIAPVDNTIIPDVRFHNEAEWIHQNSGILIRVERPDAMPVAVHESEKYVEELVADYIVENTGTLEELYDKIDLLIEDIEADNG